MAKKCARCGNPFDPTFDFHYLCGRYDHNCSEDSGVVFTDPISIQPWKGVSLLINWKGSTEEVKELADSPALFDFLEELLDHKDLDTKINWLKKQIHKLS